VKYIKDFSVTNTKQAEYHRTW